MSLTAKEFQRELDMMRSPNKWPHLVLPLKRSTSYMPGPLAGVLLGDEPTVFFANMWDLGKFDFVKGERKEYRDFEAIIDDGWRVD